jgi:4-hydroxy-2-oxoheptanedioate aldolase
MSQSLRNMLTTGQVALGLAACAVRSVEIVAVTRSCGFDWLLIDSEHSPFDAAEIATLAIAAQLAGLPSLVRVCGSDVPELPRVLDIGAQGIVVPHVDSVVTAERVVETCRFQPWGKRSVPTPLARFGFQNLPVQQMMREVEQDTIIALMIESRKGVELAESIASVPGVDAILIGINDLAADLGYPGELTHSTVEEACKTVARATRAQGKVFGVMGLPSALVQTHALALGAQLLVTTNDINLLVEAATARCAEFRSLIGNQPGRPT